MLTYNLHKFSIPYLRKKMRVSHKIFLVTIEPFSPSQVDMAFMPSGRGCLCRNAKQGWQLFWAFKNPRFGEGEILFKSFLKGKFAFLKICVKKKLFKLSHANFQMRYLYNCNCTLPPFLPHLVLASTLAVHSWFFSEFFYFQDQHG
jgi:hypothetical protein